MGELGPALMRVPDLGLKSIGQARGCDPNEGND